MLRLALIGLAMLAACSKEQAPNDSGEPVSAVSAAATNSPVSAAAPAEGASSEDLYASDASPPELNMRFQALGTEPFWSVKLVPNTATYTTPEDQKGTPAQYDFTFKNGTLRYEWKQNARTFVLIITKGTCSDGMSDTVYDWKAALTIDGKTEQGCAREK